MARCGWDRGQNPRREGYPVELFFRDQETQDLISALSQIGCSLFNFSVFVCFSINKVVPNSHIPSRFKFCSTIRSRIVSSNCFALVLPKIIFKRCVPPHILSPHVVSLVTKDVVSNILYVA